MEIKLAFWVVFYSQASKINDARAKLTARGYKSVVAGKSGSLSHVTNLQGVPPALVTLFKAIPRESYIYSSQYDDIWTLCLDKISPIPILFLGESICTI